MHDRMDRKRFRVATHDELAHEDRAYWRGATVREKLETVTYLRECLYGPEATTGRLQRVYRVVERT
jgi:hypothetical protein